MYASSQLLPGPAWHVISQAAGSQSAQALPALAAGVCAACMAWLQSLDWTVTHPMQLPPTPCWPVILLFQLQGRVDPESFLLVAEPEARANSFVGTEEYLAPEVII